MTKKKLIVADSYVNSAKKTNSVGFYCLNMKDIKRHGSLDEFILLEKPAKDTAVQ